MKRIKEIIITCGVVLFGICVTPVSAQEILSEFRKHDLRENVKLLYEENVNSDLWEYSPAFYENGIVYVGTKRNFKIIDQKHDTPFFTLKYSEIAEDNSLSSPVPFNIIGSVGNHEGPVAFYDGNNKMILTRSVKEENISDGKIPLQLYEAVRTDDGWQINNEPLSFQKPGYSYIHPAIDEKNNRLYFASDIPGGNGGMDIYYIELKDGGYSEPINLGIAVNTDRNEVFPTFNANILFFSSDGREKSNDLDIYATIESGRNWSESLKLPFPFNSDKDDLGLKLNRSSRSGYFSSHRSKGKGKDDIIRFESDIPLLPESNTEKKLLLTATDSESKKRLSGIKFWAFEADVNGLAKNKEYYESRLNELKDGELQIRLKLKDQSQLPETKTISDRNGNEELTIDTTKAYIIVAANNEYESNIKYFDFSDTTINSLSYKMDFKSCIPLNYVVFASNEITSEKIVKIRNECTGLSTEHILPKEQNTNLICLNPDCYYTVITKADSYKSDTTIFLSSRSTSDTINLKVQLLPEDSGLDKEVNTTRKLLTEPLETGSVITLRNIYYDYNKSAIRKGAAQELDALYTILKENKDVRIELNSFTDARGGRDYNLKLSLDRAISAKDYLIQKGINEDRIRAVGYGESMIKNHCQNGIECTDEEHEFNRRTEVRILATE